MARLGTRGLSSMYIRIQADTGYTYDIDSTKQCLTIYCRDDTSVYQNADGLFYHQGNGTIDDSINSGANFYTTPVIGTGAVVSQIHATCQEVTCPVNLPTEKQ